MLAIFSGSVTDSGGRTVAVQPLRQMVEPIRACVTAGLSAPGVQRGSGREYRPEPTARQLSAGGWRWMTLAEAVEKGRAARPLSAAARAARGPRVPRGPTRAPPRRAAGAARG